MNRFYAHCILCIFVSLPISYCAVHANQEVYSDNEIEQLFEEDENDIFADIAAQTTVMQQKIEIKPISRVTLAARRVWDRMLIIYLWFKQKYTIAHVYLRTRLQAAQIDHKNI